MIFLPSFSLYMLLVFFFKEPAAPRFEAQTIDNAISIGYGIALGDVDGDSKPDILLADKKQFVWYRNGDWKRFTMIDSLTRHDNVCIAARDLDGDGKVEVAVGAQWNPGETSDTAQSGSVHYLIRPADPTQRWAAVQLHHEPTVHRMQWVQLSKGKYALVVLPLHGRGNKSGAGSGVKVLAYRFPQNVQEAWLVDTLDQSMHLTHNLDVVEQANRASIYLGGKEGIRIIQDGSRQPATSTGLWPSATRGIGELRIGSSDRNQIIAAIEPMHGNELVVYRSGSSQRVLLDSNLKEGHALAIGAMMEGGEEEIVAGWRLPNREGKVGIKLYTPVGSQKTQWTSYWIDEGGMACEDLKVMDLNGDGKRDIIAAGRATHNLKIYWNR